MKYMTTLFISLFVAMVRADNFLVLGDWGGSPISPYSTLTERTTAYQMSVIADRNKTGFVIALGDNFYTFGVRNEYDPRFEQTFGAVFSHPGLRVPWYLVAGNHDHYGNVSAQIAYTSHSDIWNFPDYWHSKVFTFKDTKRTMKLIMIDTIILCGNTNIKNLLQPKGPTDFYKAEIQWAWIERELSISQEDYLIVGGHFPMWSIAEHGPTDCLIDRLKPMLEYYKVSTYICGHDHDLQHIKEDGSDVHYFVIGAANFVRWSHGHAHRVKSEYVKFHWADISKNGGFASFEINDSDGLLVTLLDATGDKLHTQTILPRNI